MAKQKNIEYRVTKITMGPDTPERNARRKIGLERCYELKAEWAMRSLEAEEAAAAATESHAG